MVKDVRLFHVSEEANISQFEPRIPDRDDLDKKVGLVWAIDEARLPNFLTPRNCPRVAYHIGKYTNDIDIEKFFSSPTMTHTIVIESKWLEIIKSTTLYLYEFNTDDFILQDDIAGYYIAKSTQIPKKTYEMKDLFSKLTKCQVKIKPRLQRLSHLNNPAHKFFFLDWRC